jgi:hypothetical protein
LAGRYLHHLAVYVPPHINRASVGIISSPVDGLVLVPNRREKHTDKEVDQNWHIKITKMPEDLDRQRAMNTE